MTRKVNAVVATSVLALLGLGLAAQVPREPLPSPLPESQVKVISGEDVGVRITDHLAKGKVQGTLVRIDGRWVEVVTSSHGVVPLSK